MVKLSGKSPEIPRLLKKEVLNLHFLPLSSLILQSVLLTAALSADAVAACFAYGVEKISIPPRSAAAITLICSSLLVLAMLSGAVAAPLFPNSAACSIGFVAMLVLGIVKLFDSAIKSFIKRHSELDKRLRFRFSGLRFIIHIYANPRDADSDRSRTLSVGESAALAVALSADGIAAGFGAGLAGFNIPAAALASLLICPVAIGGGCRLGNSAANIIDRDLSWVGGAMLILLAVLRAI